SAHHSCGQGREPRAVSGTRLSHPAAGARGTVPQGRVHTISRADDRDHGTRCASVPFLEWLHQRVVDRKGSNGSQVSWSRFEQDQPALAQAAFRLYVSSNMELPSGARVREAHRQALTADDWVALIGDYCMGVLRHSSKPADQPAWEQVHRGLLSLGYVLTRQGVRSYVSPVD